MVGPFGATPGLTSQTDTPIKPFIIAGTPVVIQVEILSTTVDTGNTGQTHILRPGLAMAQYTSGDNINKWGAYTNGGSAGLGTQQGWLVAEVNMHDPSGTVQNSWGLVAIAGQCLIDEDLVYGAHANGWTDLAYRFFKSTLFENS